MQSRATIQQQLVYQKKLLQHQQQQMSQFHNNNNNNIMAQPSDTSGHLIQGPISVGIPSSQTASIGAPFPITPRHALPNAAMLNTRMGPPNHLGQSSNLPLQHFPAAAVSSSSSSSTSESTSHFGPGAGLARLHQYSEALKEGPDRHTSDYWKSFVDEFFLPESAMHLVLWNPSTHEHKGFEVPASVVARWMQTNYISGVTSSSLSLEGPREYMAGQPFPPPPRSIRADFHLPSGNVTHFVECKKSLLINIFDNGWQVQMNGLVRAAFVPHTRVLPSSSSLGSSKEDLPTLQTHLRFECLEILITSHRSFVPSTSSFIKSQEERIPLNIIHDILAAHGIQAEELNVNELAKTAKAEAVGNSTIEKADKNDFSIKVNQVCLPDSPVNEYGITLRAMRCLEITESVCQLRDLMEFSMKEKERHLGPIDGLRRLTAQYRERDSQMQHQGLTPSNALHFDPNIHQPVQAAAAAVAVPIGPVSNQGVTGGGGGGGGGEVNGRSAAIPPSPSPHASPKKRQQR